LAAKRQGITACLLASNMVVLLQKKALVRHSHLVFFLSITLPTLWYVTDNTAQSTAAKPAAAQASLAIYFLDGLPTGR
jgi:hypothetical protein